VLGRQHRVVIALPTHEAALACWRLLEYQLIIAGYDGAQP
jgi:hypothetical protein